MKKLHLIWIIVASLLLISSVGWGFVWIFAAQDTVPKGVQIINRGDKSTDRSEESGSKNEIRLTSGASFAIGGLAIHTALQELLERQKILENVPITIEPNLKDGGQKKTWTLAELGLHVDSKAAAAAILRLQEGGMWEKAKYRLQFPSKLNMEVSWNKMTFLRLITEQWGWLNANEPTNATRTITDDDQIVYTPHTEVYRLDTEMLFKKAQQAVETMIATDWGVDAQGNAGAASKKLDVTLPLALRVVHPDVTLTRLKSQGIQRRITSFTTDFSTSGEGRVYNVTMTAKTLDGWELAPDEVFDYSKVIALTRQKYGYQEAPVILNGELVPGIGGGICQVSSTLYNAALLAGLDMVERRNHSLPVSYLPKGQDATFAEGAINFRFKNTTGKYIIIRTAVSGRKLTVKLFGTMPANVSYTIKSKTVATVEPPVKEVPTSVVQPGGRLLLSLGKSGYIVETYRTLLKDGKEISSKRISRDTYKAQPTVYGIAPGSGTLKGENMKEKKILEDGVAQ